MQVVRAEHAGACYGVQRALDMANAVLERCESAYTLGPLIHNPIVVQDLEARGAQVVHEPSEVKQGTVIIRSHGVTPQVREDLEARGLEIVDATCPHVARAQKAAGKLVREGCRVIVLGENGHPEVEGLTACVLKEGGKFDVVSSPDDIPEGLYAPIGVVVQTTQMKENLRAVVAKLEEMNLNPIVKDTICFATRQRQEAAVSVANNVDAMVIIGGRNSSNTTRLVEICEAHCPRSYHIESCEELDPAWFADCATIGVTAGASTPESQIQDVIAHLESL